MSNRNKPNQHTQKVLIRIEKSKLPIATIARDTGINSRWLYDVVAGKNKKPQYERLAIINDYLDKHQLSLANAEDN